VTAHVAQLTEVRDRAGTPTERLGAVMEAYALIAYERHGDEPAALLHRGDHVALAHQHVRDIVRDLPAEGARTGEQRDDVAADELAGYCLHALTAHRARRRRSAVS
jgi:kynureninase